MSSNDLDGLMRQADMAREDARMDAMDWSPDHLRQCNTQLAGELDRMRREMLGLLHHEPECGTCLDTGWPWIPGEENGCPTEADIQASIQWAHDHDRDPDEVLAEDRRELGCHCQK
jgi:hypothetical protein